MYTKETSGLLFSYRLSAAGLTTSHQLPTHQVPIFNFELNHTVLYRFGVHGDYDTSRGWQVIARISAACHAVLEPGCFASLTEISLDVENFLLLVASISSSI